MATARAKVKKFQKADGLPVTGHYDAATRQEIRRARAGKPSQTVKAKASRRKARTTAATTAANDPAAVTAPLTPKTLDTEVNAAVSQKYGASEQSINDQVRVSPVQSQRIGDYYAQYQQALKAKQAEAQAAYAQVAANANNQAASDQAGSGSTEAQQALASRQAMLRAQANTAGLQGANATSTYGQRQSASVLGQAQAQERETNRKNSLLAQLQSLKQQEGDYGTTLRRDARTSERNYALQNATLGLNTQKEADTATANTVKARLTADAKKQANALAKAGLKERTRHDIAGESTAQKNADTAAAKAQAAADKKAKGKPHKGPTHDAKIAASNNLTKARNLVQSKRRTGDRSSRTTYYTALVQESGIPADLARAAVELEFDGGVNNAVKNQIYRRYRIKLPHVSAGTRGSVVGKSLPTISLPNIAGR